MSVTLQKTSFTIGGGGDNRGLGITAGWQMLRQTLLNLTLALCGTLFACAVVEVYLRFNYPEYGMPVREHKLITQYDPVLGWSLIPTLDPYTSIPGTAT